MKQLSVQTTSKIFKTNISGGALTCHNTYWTTVAVQD